MFKPHVSIWSYLTCENWPNLKLSHSSLSALFKSIECLNTIEDLGLESMWVFLDAFTCSGHQNHVWDLISIFLRSQIQPKMLTTQNASQKVGKGTLFNALPITYHIDSSCATWNTSSNLPIAYALLHKRIPFLWRELVQFPVSFSYG